MRTLLFLCTGNYYRSRFAEHYFNHRARSVGLPWLAVSRGLAIERGVNNIGPISMIACQSLAALDINVPDDRRFPRQVDQDDFLIADLIVAVKEAEHRPLIQERYPSWEAKIAYWKIHDLDCAPAHAALPQLQARVDRLFGDLVMLVHLSKMGTGQIALSTAAPEVTAAASALGIHTRGGVTR